MAKSESGSARVLTIVAIVVAFALAGGGYWYWKQASQKEPEYRTAAVTRGDVIQTVTATGQMSPLTNVEVGSQVSGIISKLYADYNSRVTNGQVVAQLDPATYQATEAEAEGDLASAKAAYE